MLSLDAEVLKSALCKQCGDAQTANGRERRACETTAVEHTLFSRLFAVWTDECHLPRRSLIFHSGGRRS